MLASILAVVPHSGHAAVGQATPPSQETDEDDGWPVKNIDMRTGFCRLRRHLRAASHRWYLATLLAALTPTTVGLFLYHEHITRVRRAVEWAAIIAQAAAIALGAVLLYAPFRVPSALVWSSLCILPALVLLTPWFITARYLARYERAHPASLLRHMIFNGHDWLRYIVFGGSVWERVQMVIQKREIEESQVTTTQY